MSVVNKVALYAANRKDGMGYYNSATGLGASTDKGQSVGVQLEQVLTLSQLAALYRANGYVRRVVNLPAREMTRRGWYVDRDTTSGTQADSQATAEDDRLHLTQKVTLALQIARAYGTAYVFLATDDTSDPATPLNVQAVRNLTALHVFEPIEVTQGASTVSDLADPDYGEPIYYDVTPLRRGQVQSSYRIHRSRLLIFKGQEVPASFRTGHITEGDSIIQALSQALQNIAQVDASAAVLAQELKIDVVKITDLRSKNTSDDADALLDRIQLLKAGVSVTGLVVLTEGEEYDSRAASISGFADLSASAKSALCAQTGLHPYVLFGEVTQSGTVDGEQARVGFERDIAAAQRSELRPLLKRYYRLIFAQLDGPYKGTPPESWDVVFRPLAEISDEAKARIQLLYSQADGAYVNMGVLPPSHLAKYRFTAGGFQTDLPPIDPDALEALEQANLLPPEQLPEGTPSANDPLHSVPSDADPENTLLSPHAPPQQGGAAGMDFRSVVDADEPTPEDRKRRYKVPQGARSNAQKVLEWRKTHAQEIQGMTETGWRRARQLATQTTISGDDVIEMAAWFQRHEGNEDVPPEHRDTPWKDPGHVAHLGWGGTTMRTAVLRWRSKMGN